MNQFNTIFDIFKNTDLKIKCENKLIEYINFCIINNTESVKYETAVHHILPQSKHLPFKKYSDLKNNIFNQSILSHKNHYFAHKLLYEAIEHVSIVSAFIAMNNKDKKLKRISEIDLISSDEYHLAMKERTSKQLEWFYSKSNVDDLTNIQLIAKKAAETKSKNEKYMKELSERMKNNNIYNLPGVLEKARNTKRTRIINGKNIDTISAEKSAETMKKEILINGNITTIYKEIGKKISKILTKEIILENGTVTSLASLRGAKTRKSLQTKGKKYILKSVFKENIHIILYASDIRRISAMLCTMTKDKYLGMSKYGQTVLIKNNKENLIGLYTIPTDEDADYMSIEEINKLIKEL